MPSHLFPKPRLQTSRHQRHGYRADIDGLRGMAVLAVVCYHAFPEWLSGGFVGVDIFFVISGFLISGIIFESIQKDRLALADFYIRRAIRIFPAVVVVLLAVCTVGWFTLYADEYKQLGKHMAGAAGFVSNLIFWGEAGYFDNSAQTKPLLHFWSLAVEEQFYLIWPIALWLVSRSRVSMGLFLTCTVGLSFAAGLWHVQNDLAASFYFPHARLWELGMGAALAYSVAKEKPRHNHTAALPPRRLSGAMSVLGFVLIVLGAVVFTGDVPYPGWRALLPTLGTTLVIAAGPHAWLNRVVLSARWLVFVGLISFPLYLWHWPLLSFGHIVHAGTPDAAVRTGLIGLSLLLAWLTYRLVEVPLRYGKTTRLKVPALVGAMVVAGCLGGMCFRFDGFPQRFPHAYDDDRKMADWDYPSREMKSVVLADVPVYAVGGSGQQTLFFGDSNIEQYGPRIAELLAHNRGSERGAIFLTQGGAIPIDGIRRSDNHQTNVDNFLRIAAGENVDRVVIGAAWSLYFNADKADLGLSGPIVPRYFAEGISLEQAEGQRRATDRLEKMVAQLVHQGKVVYLLAGIPGGREFAAQTRTAPRKFVLEDAQLSDQLPGVPRAQVDRRLEVASKVLAEVAARTGATLVRPVEYLCTHDVCPVQFHKDAGHLRASFARHRLTYLDQTVSNQPSQ